MAQFKDCQNDKEYVRLAMEELKCRLPKIITKIQNARCQLNNYMYNTVEEEYNDAKGESLQKAYDDAKLDRKICETSIEVMMQKLSDFQMKEIESGTTTKGGTTKGCSFDEEDESDSGLYVFSHVL